jgi:thioredoxin reductase (NADPH)
VGASSAQPGDGAQRKRRVGNDPPRLTLLIRAYCHLCDEMRDALRPLAAKEGVELREIDVDADAALEARWGEWVPVLLAGERELCHYRLDRRALAAFLAAATR